MTDPGITSPVRVDGSTRVAVWNRSPSRADAVVAAVRARGAAGPVGARCELSSMPWASLDDDGALDDFDLVVNATSLGLREGDPSPVSKRALRPGILVYDLVYRPAPTPLERVAADAGARVANGLGLLLHQGALAFRIWTGREPRVHVMRAALERMQAR